MRTSSELEMKIVQKYGNKFLHCMPSRFKNVKRLLGEGAYGLVGLSCFERKKGERVIEDIKKACFAVKLQKMKNTKRARSVKQMNIFDYHHEKKMHELFNKHGLAPNIYNVDVDCIDNSNPRYTVTAIFMSRVKGVTLKNYLTRFRNWEVSKVYLLLKSLMAKMCDNHLGHFDFHTENIHIFWNKKTNSSDIEMIDFGRSEITERCESDLERNVLLRSLSLIIARAKRPEQSTLRTKVLKLKILVENDITDRDSISPKSPYSAYEPFIYSDLRRFKNKRHEEFRKSLSSV